MRTDNWYALHVKPTMERHVAYAIRLLPDARAYVPTQIRYERKGGLWKQRSVILLPGYVFAQTELTVPRYYELIQLPGVIRMLGRETDQSPQIPLEQMERLLTIAPEDHTMGISTAEADPDTNKLRILDGPLKDLEGDIIKISARQRRATVRLVIGQEVHSVTLALNIQDRQ